MKSQVISLLYPYYPHVFPLEKVHTSPLDDTGRLALDPLGSQAMFYASDVNDTARLDKVEYLLLREAVEVGFQLVDV